MRASKLTGLFIIAAMLISTTPGSQVGFVRYALADEAQEMAERAPEIMQEAYGGNWKGVIAIAKKDRGTLKQTDDMGWTVLHQAANKGNDTAVIELLKLGADKNARDFTIQKSRPYDVAKSNKKLSDKVRNMLK